MKIAFISQPQDLIEAGEEQRGSVSIVQWELARRLATRHRVTVYARLGSGQARAEAWRAIEIRRIPRVNARLHKAVQLLQGTLLPSWPYFTSTLYFREYFVQLAAALGADPPAIIHLQSQFQFVPMLRRAVPTARIVLHVHQDEMARIDRGLVRPALAALDRIVTVSHYVTKGIRARFPEFAERVRTIGNGVDVERFRPREHARPSAAAARLLFVGRVSPDKGVHLLLDAFAALAAADSRLELTVVGKPGFLPLDLLRSLMKDDAAFETLREFYGRSRFSIFRNVVLGHQSSYCRSLLRKLPPEIAARVRFVGTVPLPTLVELYREARLLVLPSVWNESYGLPIAEAMASGVPVVASYCGGVPELVMDGVTGRLVPRCDVRALVEALRALLSDEDTLSKMARSARARAESVLTWDRSADALERVYVQLTSQQPVPAGADAIAKSKLRTL